MIKINTQKLVKFAEAVKAIMNEVKLKVNNNQLEILQMDGSHICLIHYSIALEEPSQNCEFSLDIRDLFNMLKPIKDEFVILKLVDKKLLIESNTSKAEVNLIDLDIDEINIDCLNEIHFDQTFTLNYKTFEQIIINVKPISEVVQFEVSSIDLRYSAESKVGKIDQKVIWDKAQTIEFIDKSYSTSYAIQFLHNMRKIFNFLKIGLTNKEKSELSIDLTFKRKSPLKIDCCNNHNDFCHIYLAPRVMEGSDSDYEEEESVQQIHSDPKPIINTTILKAQLEKAKQIDMLYEQVGQINSEYNMYEEKLLKLRSDLTNKHALLTELEQSFI